MDHNVEQVAAPEIRARRAASTSGEAALKPEEIAKLTKFLRAKFELASISVRKRPQKNHFRRSLHRRGVRRRHLPRRGGRRLSYNFSMAILDFDLED